MIEYWRTLLDTLFPPKPRTAELETLVSCGKLDTLTKAVALPEPWMNALFRYRDPKVRALVWEVKYAGNTRLVDTLGDLLSDEILSLFEERANFVTGSWLLVPIPQSQEHAHEKGFNQSRMLAQAIAKKNAHSGLLLSDALKKVRETTPQAKMLSRSQRLKNLVGAFAVPAEKSVEGKNIIIIDDVITTGSTMTEAKRALRTAGAKQVFALAIAH